MRLVALKLAQRGDRRRGAARHSDKERAPRKPGNGRRAVLYRKTGVMLVVDPRKRKPRRLGAGAFSSLETNPELRKVARVLIR